MKTKFGVGLMMMLVFVMLYATSVFAQEVTDPTKVYMEESFNADEGKLQQEFHNSEVWRSGYYVDYINGVIFNLEEYARIKKEVVTNYTELAKVNPMYAQYIPQAIKEYEKALEWVEFYKLYNKCVVVDFNTRYGY